MVGYHLNNKCLCKITSLYNNTNHHRIIVIQMEQEISRYLIHKLISKQGIIHLQQSMNLLDRLKCQLVRNNLKMQTHQTTQRQKNIATSIREMKNKSMSEIDYYNQIKGTVNQNIKNSDLSSSMAQVLNIHNNSAQTGNLNVKQQHKQVKKQMIALNQSQPYIAPFVDKSKNISDYSNLRQQAPSAATTVVDYQSFDVVNKTDHKRSQSTSQYYKEDQNSVEYNESHMNPNDSLKSFLQIGQNSSQVLGQNFSIEMGKAKPKILKNLNALYQVFIPNKKQSASSIRKSEIKHAKNRSMDITNPQYYITFNKDSNNGNQNFINQSAVINNINKEIEGNLNNNQNNQGKIIGGKSRQIPMINQSNSVNNSNKLISQFDTQVGNFPLSCNEAMSSPQKTNINQQSQINLNDYPLYTNNISQFNQRTLKRNKSRENHMTSVSQYQTKDNWQQQQQHLSQVFWQSSSQQQSQSNIIQSTNSTSNISYSQYNNQSPQIIPPKKQSRFLDNQTHLPEITQNIQFNTNMSQEYLALPTENNYGLLNNGTQQIVNNSNLNGQNNNYATTFGSSHKKVNSINNESLTPYENDNKIQSTATFSQLLYSEKLLNEKGSIVQDTPRIGSDSLQLEQLLKQRSLQSNQSLNAI
ncbi:UNKNOWN [Stylonychia lemnae]|uniref:Uncharacterized protein n=1 Tax=Stylonychia lemnae TaxID=5949 RepID=A0A078ABD8_STYLE|nr:UNKNOWN [Stylonychia lemnae]|eukprot:CDW78108.1 UNKNOWN [Stylonychia lemnae]